jgi:hypothetical protein
VLTSSVSAIDRLPGRLPSRPPAAIPALNGAKVGPASSRVSRDEGSRDAGSLECRDRAMGRAGRQGLGNCHVRLMSLRRAGAGNFSLPFSVYGG